MTPAILCAGAFGTALAIALGAGGTPVILWGRDPAAMEEVERSRTHPAHMPGVALPPSVRATADLGATDAADVLLLAVPAQQAASLLERLAPRVEGRPLVACFKGIDIPTGLGPAELVAHACPVSPVAVLTGPSFAADIARGLPTALTLACADAGRAEELQHALSTRSLRLYRTTDVVGAELGGALKNVIAIACGAAIGAGLGDSARAALMTRGFAEMRRFAVARGARAETLAGLSGLGDLALTCTSPQSRNFRYGHALGEGRPADAAATVEGVPTAAALMALAGPGHADMPVTRAVHALAEGRLDVPSAMAELLERPLKEE